MASTHSTKHNRIGDAEQVANSGMQHDLSSEVAVSFLRCCRARAQNLISRLTESGSTRGELFVSATAPWSLSVKGDVPKIYPSAALPPLTPTAEVPNIAGISYVSRGKL